MKIKHSLGLVAAAAFALFAGLSATSFGATSKLGAAFEVIAASYVPVSGTTVATEETYGSYTIPGKTLSKKGALRIEGVFKHTNGADDKTMKVKLGSTTYYTKLNTTGTGHEFSVDIVNLADNDVNVSMSGDAATIVEGTEDTATDLLLAITGQKETAGDLLQLKWWRASLMNIP